MTFNYQIHYIETYEIPEVVDLLRIQNESVELAEKNRFPKNRLMPDEFVRHLFGKQPKYETLTAKIANSVVGFLIYYHTMSEYDGKYRFHVEDIFVHPDYRHRGIAKSLFAELRRIAEVDNCHEIAWYDDRDYDNTLSFYSKIGANGKKDWQIFNHNGKMILGSNKDSVKLDFSKKA